MFVPRVVVADTFTVSAAQHAQAKPAKASSSSRLLNRECTRCLCLHIHGFAAFHFPAIFLRA
jgi:hypothetical protein